MLLEDVGSDTMKIFGFRSWSSGPRSGIVNIKYPTIPLTVRVRYEQLTIAYWLCRCLRYAISKEGPNNYGEHTFNFNFHFTGDPQYLLSAYSCNKLWSQYVRKLVDNEQKCITLWHQDDLNVKVPNTSRKIFWDLEDSADVPDSNKQPDCS